MSTRDQDTQGAVAHGLACGEVATGEDGAERSPVLAALEAYNRAHPRHRVDPDEVLAQAATALDEDSEPVLAVTPAADDTGSEEPLWADEGERQEQWWQRI